jgi:co-chaperonin GroES (HSP10)
MKGRNMAKPLTEAAVAAVEAIHGQSHGLQQYQERRIDAAIAGVPVQDHVFEVIDKRSSSGYETPQVEVHGNVEGFQPAGDYVLIRRNKAVEQDGMIVRPDVAVELAERGVVVATSQKAFEVPIGAIAKFSKYGAEEINFDDAGQERYALVRVSDIRGWHA